jgi:hypothetical protein
VPPLFSSSSVKVKCSKLPLWSVCEGVTRTGHAGAYPARHVNGLVVGRVVHGVAVGRHEQVVEAVFSQNAADWHGDSLLTAHLLVFVVAILLRPATCVCDTRTHFSPSTSYHALAHDRTASVAFDAANDFVLLRDSLRLRVL